GGRRAVGIDDCEDNRRPAGIAADGSVPSAPDIEIKGNFIVVAEVIRPALGNQVSEGRADIAAETPQRTIPSDVKRPTRIQRDGDAVGTPDRSGSLEDWRARKREDNRTDKKQEPVNHGNPRTSFL